MGDLGARGGRDSGWGCSLGSLTTRALRERTVASAQTLPPGAPRRTREKNVSRERPRMVGASWGGGWGFWQRKAVPKGLVTRKEVYLCCGASNVIGCGTRDASVCDVIRE